MSCGCTEGKVGKEVVDHVRDKGKDHMPTKVVHDVQCSCGGTFKMTTVVDKCPNCGMTYGVTPCSSDDISKIQAAGINY
jgi:hypothetical protein